MKKTPLELLRAQKNRLKNKSYALTDALETNISYAQKNMGPILETTIYNAVEPKLPPFLQGIAASALNQQPKSCQGKQSTLKAPALGAVANQLIDIVPFFFKGSKAMIATFLVKQIKKFLLKTK